MLYTLTDGSSSAQATAVCRSGSALYAAGYVIDGFENEGVVWKNAGSFTTFRTVREKARCPMP